MKKIHFVKWYDDEFSNGMTWCVKEFSGTGIPKSTEPKYSYDPENITCKNCIKEFVKVAKILEGGAE